MALHLLFTSWRCAHQSPMEATQYLNDLPWKQHKCVAAIRSRPDNIAHSHLDSNRSFTALPQCNINLLCVVPLKQLKPMASISHDVTSMTMMHASGWCLLGLFSGITYGGARYGAMAKEASTRVRFGGGGSFCFGGCGSAYFCKSVATVFLVF
ncbi:Galactinol--sucrose galactosyltransferase [Sesbania bispinosa]|nr:Galactinol--sucrose galactosyltransferase [Sesbania bispinosa]